MMSDENDFSLHDMEQDKRKRIVPETPLPRSAAKMTAPTDMPLLTPEASPQELFTRRGGSDIESLQLKRTLRLIQRYWGRLLLIAILLPLIVGIYDTVLYDALNKSYVPMALRLGAQKRYAVSLQRERVPLPVSLNLNRYLPEIHEDIKVKRFLSRRERGLPRFVGVALRRVSSSPRIKSGPGAKCECHALFSG